ncbi:hypothetical protein [Amycolatopsis sp. cmx-8-4]|uniref:hypothetical protein n=1 Tax=Amycolatopsis sp. cmx-8-4 TaxID=2790947 RepID=UPI00397BC462
MPGSGPAFPQQPDLRPGPVVEQLHADDIAEAVAYIVTGPRRRAVAGDDVRPADQV